MTSSTSRAYKGIIVDANVLSLLAKVRHLDLLRQFAALPLYITPTIYRELETGFERGVAYLEDVLQLVQFSSIQSAHRSTHTHRSRTHR
jgi:hypothetical protein